MVIVENGGVPFNPDGNPLDRSSKFWRSPDGRWMAKYGHFHDWLYSPDGRRFYETDQGGMSSWGDHEEGGFSDAAGGKHRYVLDADDLSVDGVRFEPSRVRPVGAVFVPLPEKWEPRSLLQRPDGAMLYLSQDANYVGVHAKPGQAFMHLFMGRPPTLTRVLFGPEDALLYRDGGTTVIKTALGVLCVPTPWQPELRPKWTSSSGAVTDLTKLDPAAYQISERGSTATIRLRGAAGDDQAHLLDVLTRGGA